MPPTGALKSTDVQKILDWIRIGAPIIDDPKIIKMKSFTHIKNHCIRVVCIAALLSMNIIATAQTTDSTASGPKEEAATTSVRKFKL
jgi:hypothetical protein